jgi:hypothetical protein
MLTAISSKMRLSFVNADDAAPATRAACFAAWDDRCTESMMVLNSCIRKVTVGSLRGGML